ncbi:type II secretion system F family protein [Methylocystis iwaonis]|uniref:type II secretion system F family protein n=1 Tax=Methylocystis iwaonis TaxID=2885079 RepID=UPI002E7C18A9|nr:type II secretion system F family protein [Methylocystis iwaonis]
MDELVEKITNTHFVVSTLTAIAVIATIITLAMPLLSDDSLAKRMKSVSSERERIRQRERALAKSQQQVKGLRHESKTYMKNIVEKFSLSTWLNTEDAKMKLASAGFRGPQAEIAFLFFRLVTPIGFFLAALLWVVVFSDPETGMLFKAGAVIAATYLGIKAPEVFISNTIANRQQSMQRAFPDALDLMLICVESGMSIEHAFRKVGQEIGVQSLPLAEEFALATAELSYLPDRRTAYINLAARTGLDGVKQISTVLIQAEKYGTPLGQALRITAQESRDNRLMEAEKKAAALPPKLTVPMIIFFLPVLMVVVLAPAAIQVMQTTG